MKITKNYLLEVIKESVHEQVLVESVGDGTAILEDGTPVCEACLYELLSNVDESVIEEAEYQGRKVPLRKVMRGDRLKSKVYVKNPKTGRVKKIEFGDPNMRIKKSNPKRRKSFRARHKCSQRKDPLTASYWSCRAWE